MSDTDGSQHDLAAGCSVTLVTTLGEEISGTIFAFDQQTNCLLLQQEGSHSGVSTLRFLKTNYVKEVTSATKPDGPVESKLPYVDLQRAREREEKALKQAEVNASKIGLGVTKEAQAIFDALSKTMPCRWEDKTIIVLEEVSISPPYVECKASEEHKLTLDRVRMVLQAERTRLGY